MPNAGLKVVTRPEFDDATRLASYWIGKTLEEIRMRGVEVRELYREEANSSEFLAALSVYDPLTFWGLGHGNETIFSGHNREILLKVGVNLGLMSGRISHFTSCLFGEEGAPGIIGAGGIAVFAYNRDFIVGLEIEPFPESKITRSLCEPDCWIERALAEGKSCAEALAVSQAKRDEWLEYWLNSSDPDRDIIAWCIINNYTDAQILVGEGGASEPLAEPIPVTTVLGLWLSVLGIGYQLLGGTEVIR